MRIVMLIAGGIIWLVGGISCVVYLVRAILMRLYYRVYAAAHPVRERGIGRFHLQNGIAVLYEPDRQVRKYIKQFQIYENRESNSKVFVGEWAGTAEEQVEYSLIAYGSRNEILGTCHVRETSGLDRFTGETVLPEDTDYVSVVLHRVNKQKIPVERRINAAVLAWTLVFSVSVALVSDLVAWVAGCFYSLILSRFLPGTLWIASDDWVRLLLVIAGCVTVFCFVSVLVSLVGGRLCTYTRKRFGAGSFVKGQMQRFANAFRRIGDWLRKCGCVLWNLLQSVVRSTPVCVARQMMRSVWFAVKYVIKRPISLVRGRTSGKY